MNARNVGGRKSGRGIRLTQQVKMSTRMKLAIVSTASSVFLFLAMMPFFVGDMLHSDTAKAAFNTKNKNEKSVANSANESAARSAEPIANLFGGNQNNARTGYVDLTNTGILYIKGVTISNEGSFVNSSSGTTTNSGTMYIKGDFTNNGSYVTDTGKVVFWGVDAQTINGTSNPIIYNADVNNTGGVSLNVTTEFSNNLNLIAGAFDLNANRLIISNGATTALSRTSGYLLSENTGNSSKVQWNIGSTTGAHIFPFATSAAVYVPLTLDLTGGTIGNVTASTYPTAAGNTPLPSSPDAVVSINDQTGANNSANMVDRYWQIDKTGGSGTLTVTFTYTDAEVPAAGETGLVAQQYNKPTDKWVAPTSGQSASAAANTVTTPGLTAFGPFTLVKSSNPLPIHLLLFKVKLNEKEEAEIVWETGSEKNNDYFTIERSPDGKEFSELMRVPGQGNSTHVMNYSELDQHPLKGTSYYRLRQTDFDGKTETFNIEVIHLKESNATSKLIIYPNPCHNYFTARFDDTASEELEMVIVNLEGAIMYREKITTVEGVNEHTFDVPSNFRTGSYLIQFIRENKVLSTTKLIINND